MVCVRSLYEPLLGTCPPPYKVCLLRRALYGLKQALRAWFATFSSTITQLGFTSRPHDTALFTHQTPHGIVLLLLLYVDDMIITGNDSQVISFLQHYLGQYFEMKDLGSLNYFLDLEVSRHLDEYLLSQAKYAYDLLVSSGTINFKTALTPLDLNVHLTPFSGVPLEDVNFYRQLVDSLIYLIAPNPDIAYAVHIVWILLIDDLQSVTISTQEILLFLGEVGSKVLSLIRGLTLLHYDNHSVIQIAHNDVFHECSVSTIEQPADIFTKALPSGRFNELKRNLVVETILKPPRSPLATIGATSSDLDSVVVARFLVERPFLVDLCFKNCRRNIIHLQHNRLLSCIASPHFLLSSVRSLHSPSSHLHFLLK
ncbi:putative mitochondrial protein [Cucumis melo var. makuwa]|uniref:Mitochondrial protein n=1 Tax=Cucumis melo var. makuwa TaxID=1194695 RepID=A0A5D3DHH8_CUCMM|nr:putative mitochondrial protein [Cucumis melo var. makuwa]TYK23076.1 putative mitochondrial protein [Cucumis melo var. makuwa]